MKHIVLKFFSLLFVDTFLNIDFIKNWLMLNEINFHLKPPKFELSIQI